MADLANMRARIQALTDFREAMEKLLSDEEYEALAITLYPWTYRQLHRLAQMEQGDRYVPYPHPIGQGPFDWYVTAPSQEWTPEGGKE